MKHIFKCKKLGRDNMAPKLKVANPVCTKQITAVKECKDGNVKSTRTSRYC